MLELIFGGWSVLVILLIVGSIVFPRSRPVLLGVLVVVVVVPVALVAFVVYRLASTPWHLG